MTDTSTTSTPSSTETVVVGVDGSQPSDEALDWAMREAKLRGAELVAIHVGSVPWTMGYDLNWGEERDRLVEGARLDVERQVRASRERVDAADVKVTVKALLDERPGYVLAKLASEADLLVVGSRGRGGFVGAVLGSVSTTVAHHATCPVVIVRPKATG